MTLGIVVVSFVIGRFSFHTAASAEAQLGDGPSSCGDVNGDATVNVSDAAYLLNWLFLGGSPPNCRQPDAECAAPVLATGQTICYDDIEPGSEIPCSSFPYPGQDGFYQTGVPHSYRDNGNGTITDEVTGLTWAQSAAPAPMKWSEALMYCEELELGGHDDWRLPNVNELHTLVHYDRWAPIPTADPLLDFPEGEIWDDWTFWSSTSVVHEPWRWSAFTVNFGSGDVFRFTKRSLLAVRPVRGEH